MATEIRYGSIRSQHCTAVVQLHRETFPAESVNRSLYCAHGVHQYLASLIQYRSLQHAHHLQGAWHKDTLVGYAHYRALPGSWHLNNIAVKREFQNMGVGTSLLTHWIEMGQQKGQMLLSVDVLDSNARAISWYTQHGFTIVGARTIYEGSLASLLPSHSCSKMAELKGWEGAQAWQSLYGFSEFELELDGTRWRVGRLGHRFFKMTRCPSEIVAQTLSLIDPARRLIVTPVEDGAAGNLEAVARSYLLQSAVA